MRRDVLALALVAGVTGCSHEPPAAAPVPAATPSAPKVTPARAAEAAELAPNAPKDKPVGVASNPEMEQYHALMAPYVEKARQTYPEAKKRYLDGLPPMRVFFVVTRLHDGEGREEQVFITVKAIEKERSIGTIASDIATVSGYKRGDPYEFPETELVDWLISRPDGSEEGNFVGKFLDEYQKTGRRP
jgi:hypothetical protein